MDTANTTANNTLLRVTYDIPAGGSSPAHPRPTAAGEWQRKYGVIDFTNSTDDIGYSSQVGPGDDMFPHWQYLGGLLSNGTAADDATPLYAANVDSLLLGLGPRWNYGGADKSQGNTAWFTGFQLEEVGPDISLPSSFREPSSATPFVFGRRITDGKIVTRYEQQYGAYGPDPEFTPKDRLPNPEPHGDSWHNTSNNNLIFRYHQNSINYTAQTIFYPAYGDAIALEAPSGWYSTEDPRTPQVVLDVITADEKAANALAHAATAQSAADKEIIVFFEVSSNTDMVASLTGPATGNGDVWIQTDFATNQDGTPNNHAIYTSDTTSGWNQSPDNAIGRGFIEQFASVGVKNWMHSGYSTFDAPIDDYDIPDTSSGTRAYGGFTTKPYPFGRVHNASLLEIDTSGGANAYIGSTSLKYTHGVAGSGAASSVGLANTYNPVNFGPWPAKYAIEIPKGKRWIFSSYAKSNDASAEIRLHVYGANISHRTTFVGTYDANGVSLGTSGGYKTVSAADTWDRFSGVLDLSTSTNDLDQIDQLVILLNTKHSTIQARENWFDAIQLEEAPGARVLPGQFSDPDRQISDDFARALLDGKILTHYEPAIDNLKAWWRMDSANSSGWIPNVVSPGTMDVEHEGGIANVEFSSDTIFGGGKSLVTVDEYNYWTAHNQSANSTTGRGATLLSSEVAESTPKATYTFWLKPTGPQTTTVIPGQYGPTEGSAHQYIGRSAREFWGLIPWAPQNFPGWNDTNPSIEFSGSGVGPPFNHSGSGKSYRPVLLWNADEGYYRSSVLIGNETSPGAMSIFNAILDDRWNFIAITVDYKDNIPNSGETGELQVFFYNEVDGFANSGVLAMNAYSTTTTELANTGAVTQTDRHILLGRAEARNKSSTDALYDNVRFYDKILSKPDIDAIFNTRNRALKQPVIDLYPDWYANNVVYGPDPEFTPKGRLPNDAPHGDYWIDTSDGNRQFRFNQNTTNKVAQTAYYTTIAYQEDILGYEPSGWFSVGDGILGIVGQDLDQAFIDLAEAQAAADKANELLDGEIKIFFEDENATLGFANGSSNDSALFGDIWINTSDYNFPGSYVGTSDPTVTAGPPLANAIFRYQNTSYGITDPLTPGWTAKGVHVWEPAPDNGIGRNQLDSWESRDHADHSGLIYQLDNFGGYGPNPRRTPNGLENRKPHGDFWYDSANNDLQHVYYANSAYTLPLEGSPVAQTAWYGTRPKNNANQVGWYNYQGLSSWDLNHRTFRVISQGGASMAFGFKNYSTIAPFQIYAPSDPPYQAVAALYPEGATSNNDAILPPNLFHLWKVWVWDRIAGEFRTSPYESGRLVTDPLAAGLMPHSNRVLNFTQGVIGSQFDYGIGADTYWGNSRLNADGLATDLMALSSNSMVIIMTNVDAANNRFGVDGSLLDAMKYCGAANAVFGAGGDDGLNNPGLPGPGFDYQSAYILIGIPGQGEGSGVEFYSEDPLTGQHGAWTEASITFLSKRHAMISGSSSTGLMTEENIGNLQQDVLRAQAAADREINTFFALSSVPQTATGNGDIWIQTDTPVKSDGTVNTGAIFVANTLVGGLPAGGSFLWHNSPRNGYGLQYLQMYADNISGEFDGGDNLMPRGYSVFDAPASDYEFIIGEGGVDTVKPYPISTANGNDIISIDNENGYIGSSSLKYEDVTIAGSMSLFTHILFANNGGNGDISDWNSPIMSDATRLNTFKDYGISIPTGRRWIYSLYVKTNQAAGAFAHKLHSYTSNGSSTVEQLTLTDYRDSGATWFHLSDYGATSSNEWTRVWKTIDLTEAPYSSANSIILSILPHNTDSPGAGNKIAWYDGIQLEEVPAHRNSPTPFKTPDSTKSLDFARAIADGKIVEFHEDGYNYDTDTDELTRRGLPSPGPTAWWGMNSANATGDGITNIISPGANDAFFTAAIPTFIDTDRSPATSASGNSAYLVGGTNSRIGLIEDAYLQTANTITFTTWHKPVGSHPTAQWPTIFSRGVNSIFWLFEGQKSWTGQDLYSGADLAKAFDASVGDTENIWLRHGSTTGGTVTLGNSAGSGIGVDLKIVFGVWNFFAVRFDYTNQTFSAYCWNEFDGNEIISTASMHASTPMPDAENEDVFLGGTSSSNRNVNGYFDQTRYYERVLTDAEVRQLAFQERGFHGPVTNPTPQGLPNPTPYGDKWFDTANNNTEFWHFANATHKEETTAYWTNGPASETTGDSGWYSLEDPRTPELTIHKELVEAVGGDRQLQAFFTSEPPTFGNPDYAATGDIWIDTDTALDPDTGTQNAASVHIANGTPISWKSDPLSPSGISFLQGWDGKARADRKILFRNDSSVLGGFDGALYGPKPNFTTEGIINPEPHGDKWEDAGNNNVGFIYFQNTAINTSQTIFWSSSSGLDRDGPAHSGWYHQGGGLTSWDTDHHSFHLVASGWNNQKWGGQNESWLAPRQILGGSQAPEGLYSEDAPDTSGRLHSLTNSSRSYMLYVWDRIAGQFRTLPNSTSTRIRSLNSPYDSGSVHQYDTYYDRANADSFATDLNSLSSNSIVMIIGAHEPRYNRFGTNNSLLDAMKRCGASNNVFGAEDTDGTTGDISSSTEDSFRRLSSYILIGTPGIGEDGAAIETYSGGSGFFGTTTPSAANDAWTEAHVTFLSKSNMMVSGGRSNDLVLPKEVRTAESDIELFRAAGVDHEQITFTQIAPPPTAAGPGDIWIEIDNILNPDGTANTNSIFVANTLDSGISMGEVGGRELYWNQSPDSALGGSHLNLLVESNFSSGANWMPRPYSLFDTRAGEYSHYKYYGGSGTDAHATLWITTKYPFTSFHYSNTVVNTSFGFSEDVGSFQTTTNGTSTTSPWSYFSWATYNNDDSWNPDLNPAALRIPRGKKWIISWHVNTDTPDSLLGTNDSQGRKIGQARFYVEAKNNSLGNFRVHDFGASNNHSFYYQDDISANRPGDGWQRMSMVLDFTSGETANQHATAESALNSNITNLPDKHYEADLPGVDTSIPVGWTPTSLLLNEIDSLFFRWYPSIGGATNANNYWISGIQLEEVPGDRITPAPFRIPSSEGQLSFLRGISDGQTITYTEAHAGTSTGPDPTFTPNGLLNPEPHGDAWEEAGSNSNTYSYHVEGADKTSRTIYEYKTAAWTSKSASGWYQVADVFGHGLTVPGSITLDPSGSSVVDVDLGSGIYPGTEGTGGSGDGGSQTVGDLRPFEPGATEGGDLGTNITVTRIDDPEFDVNEQQILLNPVAPSDANLHGHWTFNSFNVDQGTATRYLPDKSGRGNHARVVGFTSAQQSAFSEQDPSDDVINISGDNSLHSAGSGSTTGGHIVLGIDNTDGAGNIVDDFADTLSDGTKIPLDISDTTLYNKQTICFWLKPDGTHSNYFAGRGVYNNWSLLGAAQRANNNPVTDNHNNTPQNDDEFGLTFFVPMFDSTIIKTYRGIEIGFGGSPAHYNIDVDSTFSTAASYNGGTRPNWFGRSGGLALKKDAWHFIVVQFDYSGLAAERKSRFWLFREGEGLLYQKSWPLLANLADGAAGANTNFNTILSYKANATPLLLGADTHNSTTGYGGDGLTGTVHLAQSFDEARLYNTILTPRNIQYLFDNPSGRPFSTGYRPGIGIKMGYYPDFFTKHAWSGDEVNIRIFYVHGYDVDGNSADVPPKVTVHGREVELKQSTGHLTLTDIAFSGTEGSSSVNGRTSNTVYIYYNEEAIGGADPKTMRSDSYYSITQPIPENASGHDWQFNGVGDTSGWTSFKAAADGIIVGEATLIHIDDLVAGQGFINHEKAGLVDITPYQQARTPGAIRDGYNFNVLPNFIRPGHDWDWSTNYFGYKSFWDGFIGTAQDGAWIPDASIGTAFIANAAINQAKIDLLAVNSAQIQSVNASTITTGSLDVGPGGVTMDGLSTITWVTPGSGATTLGDAVSAGVGTSGLDTQVAYDWPLTTTLPHTANVDAVYVETVDNMQVVTIAPEPGTPTFGRFRGASWRAFNVEDGLIRTFSVTSRPDSAGSTAGYYVRVYEYRDGALPADKFYVDTNAYPHGPNVQDGVQKSISPSTEAFVLSTTAWVTNNYTYTPSASAEWASVVVLCWSGMSPRKLHVQPIHINTVGADGQPGADGADGADSIVEGPQGEAGTPGLTVFLTYHASPLSSGNPPVANPPPEPPNSTGTSGGWGQVVADANWMSTKTATSFGAASPPAPAWSAAIQIRGEDGSPIQNLGAGFITTGTIATDSVITVGTLGGASITIDGGGKRIVIRD